MKINVDIKKVHTLMLTALKEFHEFCVNNDVNYTLIGGTLLGAVREKGFIPWDDDADVVLFRKDYDKLKKNIKKFKSANGIVFNEYYDKVPRFEYRVDDNSYVWIDVYVFDYVTSNKFLQKVRKAVLAFFTAFTKNEKTFYISYISKKERSKIEFFFFKLIYYFGKLFPRKFKLNVMDRIQKNLFTNNKNYLQISNDEYSLLDLYYDHKIIDGYILTDFEDTKLFISKEYDYILKLVYGDDYMIPKQPDSYKLQKHHFTQISNFKHV